MKILSTHLFFNPALAAWT